MDFRSYSVIYSLYTSTVKEINSLRHVRVYQGNFTSQCWTSGDFFFLHAIFCPFGFFDYIMYCMLPTLLSLSLIILFLVNRQRERGGKRENNSTASSLK